MESKVSLPPVLPEHDVTDQNNPPGHDKDYLRRREAQERAAAEQSPDPAARHAHGELADRYAERLHAATPAAG